MLVLPQEQEDANEVECEDEREQASVDSESVVSKAPNDTHVPWYRSMVRILFGFGSLLISFLGNRVLV